MAAVKFPEVSNLTQLDSARISRIESALPTIAAGQRQYTDSSVMVPSSSAVLNSGLISPSSGISTTGNTFPFVVQGAFSFVSSGSNLTIYWDGTHGSQVFVMRRADGTNLTIPSGSLAMGGLPPGRYGFAPFIAVSQPQTISFVAGDVGAPRFAFSATANAKLRIEAARIQRLTSNESLTSGFVYFTSTGANTGPGVDQLGNNPYTGQP